MTRPTQHRTLERYRDAFEAKHGEPPAIRLAKGWIIINGRNYELDEVAAMAARLEEQLLPAGLPLAADTAVDVG